MAYGSGHIGRAITARTLDVNELFAIANLRVEQQVSGNDTDVRRRYDRKEPVDRMMKARQDARREGCLSRKSPAFHVLR